MEQVHIAARRTGTHGRNARSENRESYIEAHHSHDTRTSMRGEYIIEPSNCAVWFGPFSIRRMHLLVGWRKDVERSNVTVWFGSFGFVSCFVFVEFVSYRMGIEMYGSIHGNNI